MYIDDIINLLHIVQFLSLLLRNIIVIINSIGENIFLEDASLYSHFS